MDQVWKLLKHTLNINKMKKLNPNKTDIRHWLSRGQCSGYSNTYSLNVFIKSIFFLLSVVLCFSGCRKITKSEFLSSSWDEIGTNSDLVVKPGIPAYKGTLLTYNRGGKSILTVKLEEPNIAGVATKPEGWGYFQFPYIYFSKDSVLVAKWNLAEDAVTSYGQGNSGFALSYNKGKSWTPGQRSAPAGEGFILPNGDQIGVITPKAIDTGQLILPKPVAKIREADGNYYILYKHSELPEVLQGVYISRIAKGQVTAKTEHAILDDPKAVRYSTLGLFPIVWWGDMHIAADGSIITGIYPGFCTNDNGGVNPAGILFYRSTDSGHSWKIQGRIPYEPDLKTDPNGATRVALGFTEPAFQILSDGTYVCVMRTTGGPNGPMYISRSTDLGVTWSKPETFTRAGVLPQLLQLKNGIIVLASGRPGVQLRFCMDGKGLKWTDPFEMLPWETEKETVSCGYTRLLATGSNKFLVVYSDFNYKNKAGEIRKAIKVREVTITQK